MNSSNSKPDCSQPNSSKLSPSSVIRDADIMALLDTDQEPSLSSFGPPPAILIASPVQPPPTQDV